MRKSTVIFIMMFAAIFVVASSTVPGIFTKKKKTQAAADSAVLDSTYITDSLGRVIGRDTLLMDSLTKAIYKRNLAIDDSIRLDSVNRAKSKGIDAPVSYASKDSMIYEANSRTAHLFGNANVKYEDMDLVAERVHLSMDSDLVRAEGVTDTAGVTYGTPVFKMGGDEYESNTMKFNFKSKKGLINDVYTAQDDGFMKSEISKRDSSGTIYMKHGRYTTCDDPHPDFYIALSRAKVKPGKNVVFGPAYLVVADVPLPLAIPYGFFPFTKSYSSGVIMPTYGDEQTRGFYLRDGGYYFAINDRMDLKLLGEIYTKGSWGLSANMNYRKRYKYNGSFYFSYQDTKIDDDNTQPRSTSFKIQWSHRQDSKANPYSSLSASVNFATTNYERNNLSSLYNPYSLTQSTRTSSVSYSTTFSSIGMTLSATTNIAQNTRDSTISLTLPDLNVSVSRFYPFKRKHMVGKERWYEKISLSYTGSFSNSINTKESELLKSSLVKDWRNGMQHQIPISGSFTLFNVLNINPSISFTDRMYSQKIMRSWDEESQREVGDTLTGFYNVYNWNLSVSASTKLYGFFVPNKKLFGDKVQAIRHVMTPTVSFSYAPDFSTTSYGFYDTYLRTDASGNVTLVKYSPYQNNLYGTAPSGKTGSVSFDLSNNLEMKIKSDKDTTGFKKLSLIDEWGMSMSYNMAAKERPLSDLNMRLRLKWWKNYTFNMNAVFATYAYDVDKNGRPYVGTHTEYSRGRFGRFQGMSQNLSYTLTPEKIKKLFGGGSDDDDNRDKKKGSDDDDDDVDLNSNIDDTMIKGQNGAKKESSGMAETDEDGYVKFSMPWSLTFGYGITMRENTGGDFNYDSMRYPYKFTQTLNMSGNVRISDGWNITFSSGYDFDNHKVSMTTASLSRDLHCFNMSCSVVITPYTSYNFTFRCNAATLTDALKYDKRSSYSNSVKWY